LDKTTGEGAGRSDRMPMEVCVADACNVGVVCNCGLERSDDSDADAESLGAAGRITKFVPDKSNVDMFELFRQLFFRGRNRELKNVPCSEENRTQKMTFLCGGKQLLQLNMVFY
jgi:hypothetical protein